jgi:DNA-binding SARP family transcriptional activator
MKHGHEKDDIPSELPGQKSPEPTAGYEFPLYSELNNFQPHVVSRPDQSAQASDDKPSLTVYCLGPFQLYQDEEPVEEWASGKGKSVFKYLVTHHHQPVAKEVLMDIFWPDSDPDAARNSLNVAIYGLRQALRKGRPRFHHVLFEDDRYLLNPDLHIWLDVEEFRQRLSTAQKLQQRGNMGAATRLYGACEALYRGEFLAEDRYEEWAIPYRRKLQDDYLGLLEQLSRYYLQQEAYATCIITCEKMLAVEPCREDAHRQLMRAYSRQGQRYLALRQYHACREVLDQELGVDPDRRTVELYEKSRRREPI